MRRLTFSLSVELSPFTFYRLIEERNVDEKNMVVPDDFDKLVEVVKKIGCKFKIERVTTVLIEDNRGSN